MSEYINVSLNNVLQYLQSSIRSAENELSETVSLRKENTRDEQLEDFTRLTANAQAAATSAKNAQDSAIAAQSSVVSYYS